MGDENNDNTLTNLIKELVNKLEELKITVSTLVAQQQDDKQNIQNINEKISNSDNGIHKKLNDLSNEIKTLKEYEIGSIKTAMESNKNELCTQIKNLEEKQKIEKKELEDDLKEKTDKCLSLEIKMDRSEKILDNLVSIAGSDRLENLDSTIKTNQNSKRIIWAFIIATLSILAQKLF